MKFNPLASWLFLLAAHKPQDLASTFRLVYDELARPGTVSYPSSPTIRFDRVSNESSTQRPIALYLPGLDGYGVSAATYQFQDMARTFDFWRLFIDPRDRSSFRQVTSDIAEFIIQLNRNTSQPVTLVGESCGGLLAAATAIRLRDTAVLKGLVLVNPATSFEQTSWDLIVPQLAVLDGLFGAKDSSSDTTNGRSGWPSPYSVVGSLVLASTVPDMEQLRRILSAILSTPGSPSDFVETALVGFRETEARLPAQLLQHRIQWLSVGAPIVNARISSLQVPTLVVVGKQDNLLPSDAEADRLLQLVPSAEKLVVRQRGHFVLDQSVNLTEAIVYSRIDPLNWSNTKKKYDPITDWQLPDEATIQKVMEARVEPLIKAHSPVWFSTDGNGKRWRGLTKVPRPKQITHHDGAGPLLVIGNHQLAGLDLGLILTELRKQCGFWPRGLAHPITFFGSQDFPGELQGRRPGLLDGPMGSADLRPSFQMFGAVQVTPRNYYRLMQTGQHALLFPGGAKEAQSGRKDYPLFWPEKVDFVRTAAKFNATILPLSAIGMVDSVNVIAEPQQVADIPFLGSRLRSFNANISAARFVEKNEDEVIGFPIAVPQLPARNYFLFGKPLSLKDVDPNDREACSIIYDQVKFEVQKGIIDLLRAREDDLYKDAAKRLAYEQVTQKQAPTFAVDKLNTYL